MSTIEERARDALNEVARERHQGLWHATWHRGMDVSLEAMCRQIEAHDATKAEFEALKHEVSEAVRELCNALSKSPDGNVNWIPAALARFILPEPVDPLVEIMRAAGVGQGVRDEVMTELAKRGLTITEQQP